MSSVDDLEIPFEILGFINACSAAGVANNLLVAHIEKYNELKSDYEHNKYMKEQFANILDSIAWNLTNYDSSSFD